MFKINAVHKNLKRDIGLVSDVNDMNYLESHAGDVIDKDVKFVYSPSNREGNSILGRIHFQE